VLVDHVLCQALHDGHPRRSCLRASMGTLTASITCCAVLLLFHKPWHAGMVSGLQSIPARGQRQRQQPLHDTARWRDPALWVSPVVGSPSPLHPSRRLLVAGGSSAPPRPPPHSHSHHTCGFRVWFLAEVAPFSRCATTSLPDRRMHPHHTRVRAGAHAAVSGVACVEPAHSRGLQYSVGEPLAPSRV
jgi:hypothetical protein